MTTDGGGSDGPLGTGDAESPWRGVTAVCVALTVVCTLPIMLAGALAVQMREELQFGVAALGGVIALYRGAGAVVSTSVGRFADRVGPVQSMRLAAGVAAAVGLGVAAFARSWLSFALLLMAGSVAYTLGQAGANLLISRAVPTRRQGTAFGLKQAALPGGSLLAGVAVPVVALTVGWRWAWVAGAVSALLVASLVPSSRDQRTRANPSAQNRTQRTTPLLLLGVALFFAVSAATTLTAFTVDAVVSAGHSPAVGGVLLALGSATSIIVRLVAGWMADRRSGGHLAVVTNMVLVGAVGYALLAVPNLFGMTVGTLLAFGLGWGFNGLFWFAIVRMNQRTPGRAVGVVNVGGLLGGLAGPLTFGWVVETWGYSAAWGLAAAWGLIGGVVMLLARRLVVKDAR